MFKTLRLFLAGLLAVKLYTWKMHGPNYGELAGDPWDPNDIFPQEGAFFARSDRHAIRLLTAHRTETAKYFTPPTSLEVWRQPLCTPQVEDDIYDWTYGPRVLIHSWQSEAPALV